MEIGLGYVQNELAFTGSRLAFGAEEEDGQGVYLAQTLALLSLDPLVPRVQVIYTPVMRSAFVK